MLKRLAIDELMEQVADCDLPYKYFITYDYHLGNRYEHEQFVRDYVWNGVANRLHAKLRVWAVGLNPIGKRDHFHAVISSSKDLEQPCKLYGIVNVPLLMVIDALFEQQNGKHRFNGDKFFGDVTTHKDVILNDNARFFRAVPFGGYDRHRLQIQPYDADRGALGYIFHKHEVVLWTGDGVINEFKRASLKRRRCKRGKKRGGKELQ